MGDYSNTSQQNFQYWNPADQPAQMNYYENDYNTQFENQQLGEVRIPWFFHKIINFFVEFSPMEDYNNQQYYPQQMYDPSAYLQKETDDFDEPPLLEELEIYPDRILQKVLAVLNPFRAHSITDDSEYLTKDTDLAGPIAFCIILALCLFLSGNKAHFGYIYGISMVSCILMYALLTLMTPASGVFNINTVASVLGYCLIPIVGLSLIGLFISLNGLFGITFASFAVIWASISASRLFVAISGDKEQQPLIAYPCALVYGVYVLLVVF